MRLEWGSEAVAEGLQFCVPVGGAWHTAGALKITNIMESHIPKYSCTLSKASNLRQKDVGNHRGIRIGAANVLKYQP